MNERNTLHYKNISLTHFILERGTQFVVSLRDWWRDIYSERGIFLAPYHLPGARGANACTPLQAVSSETTLTPLIGCVSLARLSIQTALTVYIWPRGSHIMWSPSGYTPVWPAYSDALPSPCLLITTWLLVKALGVTRNKPQIHVNSHYITRDIVSIIIKMRSKVWIF